MIKAVQVLYRTSADSRPCRLLAVVPCLLAVALVVSGCQKEVVEKADATPPPPTFTGPAFLHGTVGSLATLRGYEPMLVSGWGLVVRLDGTGSSQVPAFLEGRMINDIVRGGFGSARLGTRDMSARRVLASRDTAVVRVEGMVQPGAVRGGVFDVLVTAVDGTDTTSLEGGQLLMVDLAVGGASEDMRFRTTVARATGPLYMGAVEAANHEDADDSTITELRRQAVILSGGVVTVDRRLELELNAPNWNRSQLITDRINETFNRGVRDPLDTAVAKTDLMIDLNIPTRHLARSGDFLNLVRHLYVQRSPGFEPDQARRLGEVILAEPKYADRVGPAWVALGKTALPTISQFYDHPDLDIRLIALEAGVRLEDSNAARHLERIARVPDPQVRRRVAGMLVHLPRNLVAGRTLIHLVDDEDNDVRLTAYESLARIGDPILDRIPIGDRESFKFILDLVPSDRPMIYVTSSGVPRVVIFDPNLRIRTPMVASLWDSRLMLRATSSDSIMDVFYQKPASASEDPDDNQAQILQIAPAVANLVRLMAQKNEPYTSRGEGLDLSYSQVLGALSYLKAEGYIDADLVIEESPLAQAVEMLRDAEPTTRPEFSTAPAPGPEAIDTAPPAEMDPDSDLGALPLP